MIAATFLFSFCRSLATFRAFGTLWARFKACLAFYAISVLSQGPAARGLSAFQCRFGQFCFLRFLGFLLQLAAFRANPGTTRPPALALASTSSTG